VYFLKRKKNKDVPIPDGAVKLSGRIVVMEAQAFI